MPATDDDYIRTGTLAWLYDLRKAMKVVRFASDSGGTLRNLRNLGDRHGAWRQTDVLKILNDDARETPLCGDFLH